MTAGNWQPVLEGELADRALAAIDRVSTDLGRLDPAARDFGASVAGGSGGFAVLFAELARRGSSGAADVARAHVDAAMDAVAAEPMPPSLFAGFISVAWVLSVLEGVVLEVPDEPPAGELEEVLLRFLERSPWPFDYDLVSGPVGFAVYALRRRDDPFGRAALATIMRRLEEIAVRSDAGAAWFTPGRLLPEHQRLEYPGGYFNGGLAHGIPGVVAIAGQVSAATGDPIAADLAEAGWRWLETQRLPAGSASWFPATVSPDGVGKPSRLAWCYGDPGVAAALHVAGTAMRRDDIVDAAIDGLRACAGRPHEHSGVFDAGLCHGSAGLGHIYNRFFQATGEELFLREARYWLSDALDRSAPGDTLGGFQAWTLDGYSPDPALLTGSAGVALALLAATGDAAPTWDELLLVAPV